MSPAGRRQLVEHVQQRLGVSERRACRVLKQARATQRLASQSVAEEVRLTARVVELASQYGRYGYRRITALLRGEGWRVNHKRVERIWRREGLKVPAKNRNVVACGSTTARVSGCGPATPTMSGATTSWPTAPTTAQRSAF